VARSNEAAWAASEKDSRGKEIDKYDWHSYSWLAAAYLELGQVSRARKLMDQLAERIKKEDNADPRWAYSLVAHLLITNSEAWDRIEEVLAPIASHLPLEHGETQGSLGCAQHAPGAALATRHPVGLISQERVQLMRAEAAMRRGDEAGVRAALGATQPIRDAIEAWHAMFPPSYYERRKANDSFLYAAARALHDKSAASFAKAVEAAKKLIEAGDPYANGPAFDPPAEQWLGELQLAAGQPKEALAAFDAALAKHPRLSRSLLGAARAAHSAQLDDIARARYAELAALWREADPELPDVIEARAQTRVMSPPPSMRQR
jgi:tetratricopeptide (TPR) repeat protein